METLFDRLQMNEIRDVLGAKMSTGMKQKVSIARAIVHDPPVLIFDEATSGLDVLVARALLKTVAELRDHGKCVVFSTHIMREAEKLCDRIAIMHRGHILAEGTLDELRDRHDERDLEELLGLAWPGLAATAGQHRPARDRRPVPRMVVGRRQTLSLRNPGDIHNGTERLPQMPTRKCTSISRSEWRAARCAPTAR